jgi:serine/threonine protein kinase
MYKFRGESSYDKESEVMIAREADVLKNCVHSGVVKCFESGFESVMRDGKPWYQAYFVVLEYLSGGSLFDLVTSDKKISNELICHMFLELLNILTFINSKGYVHLDIKLENVMISKEGKLKFIDFGFTRELHGDEGNGKITQFAGTANYKAPEVIETKPFMGIGADIFSLGVVFFAMYFKLFPFNLAKGNDSQYGNLFKAKYVDYQKYLYSQASSIKKPLSDDFIELVIGMFIYNPLERLTIPEIATHRWIISNSKLTPEEGAKTLKELCGII